LFSRKSVLALLAVVFALGAAAPSFAGKGGGGSGSVSIAFADTGAFAAARAPSAGSSIAFSVSSNLKSGDAANLWITNYCTQNGSTIYAESHGAGTGYSGPFNLSWSGGGAAECTAYAWVFPNANRWLGTMTYSAAG
jgi:hypothetical protein